MGAGQADGLSITIFDMPRISERDGWHGLASKRNSCSSLLLSCRCMSRNCRSRKRSKVKS